MSLAEAREQYSLWVVPRGTLGQQLQDEIVHLAGRHPHSPVFHPHVTVLWPLEGPKEKVVNKVQQLAAKVKKYRVSFEGVTCGSEFYQCVYLLAHKDPGTMAAGAAAREAFGIETRPYMPHLSLLYSDMSQEQRQAVAEYARGRLAEQQVEMGFDATHFVLWYTPGDDTSAKSWQFVGEWELAG